MALWNDLGDLKSEDPGPSPVSKFFFFVSVSFQFTILDMGLINKVDMVCLSPVGYGV